MKKNPYRASEDLTLQTFVDAGFEEVLDLPFFGRGYNDKAETLEHFRVFAHRDGLLATVDSFAGHDVNSAKVFYNWRPNKDIEWWGFTSSGHMGPENTWIGDHDARWGLRHNIENLRQHGELVNPWIEQPFLWLLHYQDTADENYDYGALNRERLALLPDWVQAFTGEYPE